MEENNILRDPSGDQTSTDIGRRNMLGRMLGGASAVAVTGALFSREEEVLAAALAPQDPGVKVAESDGLSGASRLYTNWAKLEDLKKKMVKSKLHDIPLSRMFLGGNLIGGWAHARDLIYVSDLVKAYHTREKIYATFQMGEACGINAYMGHHSHIGFMVDYWEKKDGQLKFLADCGDLESINRCANLGAATCYIQGEVTDRYVREEKFDELRAMLDAIHERGLKAGIGAHRLSSVQACVDRNFEVDYWMKTIHHDRYWSRRPNDPEHDNVFCREPNETIEYMNSLPQPWIGFKVLAAGAIRPEDGFRYAFESGADFICVGMYDFQIVENVNTCMGILDSELKRTRAWHGA